MTQAEAISITTKMLKHYPFTYCPTLAAKTENHTPHRGDIVLFHNGTTFSHTGLVYQTDGNYFYTIEGNTSGASGIIANGGGVCTKKYKTAGYSKSKFFRPDYSLMGFASDTVAISKVIETAKNEVGYLEKKSNSQLYEKTANAGSANYTKYWNLYPGLQAQPWCAIFVTWCFVKTLEGGETKVSTTAKVNVASGMQKYKNGSTPENVYQTSECKSTEKIGTLNEYEECYCFGTVDNAYLICYRIDGTSHWKCGYVRYDGKTTF